MEQSTSERPGIGQTLRRMGRIIAAIVQNRVELLVVELQEERIRFFNALILAAVVLLLGFFSIMTGAAALLIVVWDRYGVPGLLVSSGAGLLCTGFAYWRLHLRLKNWPLLAGTIAELKKDKECLENEN